MNGVNRSALDIADTTSPETESTATTSYPGACVGAAQISRWAEEDELDEEEARGLVQDVKLAAEDAFDVVVQAFVKKVWIPLGYKNFIECIAGELDGYSVTVPAAYREMTIANLVAVGMSTRAIETVTGISKSTVSRLKSSGVPSGTPASTANIVGIDGKKYTQKPRDRAADIVLRGRASRGVRLSSLRIVEAMAGNPITSTLLDVIDLDAFDAEQVAVYIANIDESIVTLRKLKRILTTPAAQRTSS